VGDVSDNHHQQQHEAFAAVGSGSLENEYRWRKPSKIRTLAYLKALFSLREQNNLELE